MDSLVHEIDNYTIKQLESSITKYNAIIGYAMPEVTLIDKERYFNKRNILTQVKRS